jgi:hypothetical protein
MEAATAPWQEGGIMACVNPDGELTESARQILTAMERPILLSQVAANTGLPLYRIRSSIRELAEAGFAAEAGGEWQITGGGMAALHKSGNAA